MKTRRTNKNGWLIVVSSVTRNRYLPALALIILSMVLPGCATKTMYSSLKGVSSDSIAYELIIADERDVLDAAYDAIQNRFPETAISPLAGKEKGFTFYTQPALDRTTYKLVIEKAVATTQDGKTVTGYYYSIYSHGTQFLVESRYIEPLIQEFHRMLKRRHVTFTSFQSIKFEE